MRLLTDPKRLFPLLLGAAAGALTLVSLFQPNIAGDVLLEIVQITTAFALLLGFASVLRANLGKVARRASGWPYSITLIAVALIVFTVEIVSGTAVGPLAAQAGELASDAFRYVYQPLATSILALLTFFALRAAWRALHARPREAVPILIVAVVFLLAGGPWASALPGLQETLDWVRSYPALGVARGILLGVALGAVVATVRLLLGFDQPYLDR